MITLEQFTKLVDSNLFSEFFIQKLYNEINMLINVSLEEDLGELGDVTTLATSSEGKTVNADIIAKQSGVFSGGFIAEMVFKKVDNSIKICKNINEGDVVEPKKSVLSISGPAKSVLVAERTAINFLSRTSGISSLTHTFVKHIEGSNIKILDTRKTCPGWRYIDKYAVKLGGGFNHRIGLFDMFLIKENHITASGGITNAVNACRKYLKKNNLDLKIEVETRNFEEVQEAMNLRVDRIMLDNMAVETIKKSVKLIDEKCEVEISGGINSKNIQYFTDTGVDFISIGEITHSVKAFDFSLIVY